MIMRTLVLMIVLIGYGIADKAYTDISFAENKLIFHTTKPHLILDRVEFYPYYVDLCSKQSNQITTLKNEVRIYKLREDNRDKMDDTKTGIAKLSVKKRKIVIAVIIIGTAIICYGSGTVSGILLSRKL